MKFELVNPSDKIFLEADDVQIAKVAAVVVGNGLYGLKDETGELILGILKFGGADEFLNEMGGQDGYNKLLTDRALDLATCLRTFQVGGGERTSINDICGRAYKLAHYFETRSKGPL